MPRISFMSGWLVVLGHWVSWWETAAGKNRGSNSKRMAGCADLRWDWTAWCRFPIRFRALLRSVCQKGKIKGFGTVCADVNLLLPASCHRCILGVSWTRMVLAAAWALRYLQRRRNSRVLLLLLLLRRFAWIGSSKLGGTILAGPTSRQK